jgi:hypothetical protein
MKHPCAHVVVTVRLGIASSLSGFGFCISCARPLVPFPLGHFCDDTEIRKFNGLVHSHMGSALRRTVREALGVGAEGIFIVGPRGKTVLALFPRSGMSCVYCWGPWLQRGA